MPEDVTIVLRQFRLVFNAVKAHLQQVQHKAGATGAQVWALHLIQSNPGLGVNQLALLMSVRQPTASILVRSLTRAGLATSERAADDRRSVRLQLTAAGAELLARVPGPYEGILPNALAAMDPHALRALKAPLAALIGHLGADARLGEIPLGAEASGPSLPADLVPGAAGTPGAPAGA